VTPLSRLVLSEMTVVVDPPTPSEGQMGKAKPSTVSKRKSATSSKRVGGQKIVARAQRNKHPAVRSPKGSPLHSVAADSTETRLVHPHSTREASVVGNRASALDDVSPMIRDNHPKKGFEFSLATPSVRAYQIKLLELTEANMQFAFEFGQRLAVIKSPFEFVAVIAEFTNRRVAMFRKYSKEMAVYPF
jgi:hypothetical protein